MTTEIKVERVGGFAGFGLPGSRIESKGRVDLGGLSHEDKAAVDRLFSHVQPHTVGSPDAFRYRLTRLSPGGEQTVEVPEHQVPQAVRDCVKDQLK